MGSGNTVLLQFAGDSKSLDKTVANVGQETKNLAGEFESSGTKAKTFSDHLSGIDDGANTTRKSMRGLALGLDGVDKVFGTNLQAQVDMIRGFKDIAHGIESFALPMIEKIAEKFGLMTAAQEETTAATEGLTEATEAQDVAEGIALGPILLIVGAVALVGAAIYELATHWSAVWSGIKTAVTDAWNWISARLGDIVGFVASMPGRIVAASRGMWDGLKEAFRAAINWIIDGWNRMHFTMPSIDTHIPGIGKVGGFDLGLPQIPRLAAGGITSGPTLAMIGDNPGGREAILPLPAAGGALGQTIVNLTVVGSVVTERQLVDVVHDGLLAKQRKVGPLGIKAS